MFPASIFSVIKLSILMNAHCSQLFDWTLFNKKEVQSYQAEYFFKKFERNQQNV